MGHNNNVKCSHSSTFGRQQQPIALPIATHTQGNQDGGSGSSGQEVGLITDKQPHTPGVVDACMIAIQSPLPIAL